MSKLGNEKMGASYKKSTSRGIVSLFNFGKVLNFAKVWDEKATC